MELIGRQPVWRPIILNALIGFDLGRVCVVGCAGPIRDLLNCAGADIAEAGSLDRRLESLVRHFNYGSEGWEFESSRARPGHVFYDRLQSVLIEGGFDGFVEAA